MVVRKKAEDQEKVLEKKDTSKKEYIHAVGRRREAVARVRLYKEKGGQFMVNGKPAEEYFPLLSQRVLYEQPFEVTGTQGNFTVTIKVEGGGPMGQLEAVVHGISRALVKYDKENFRPVLKKHKLLTRDSRIRQRRMIGMGGKSRRRKQSPKR